MKTETIINTGIVTFTDLTRYEHHKVSLSISDYTDTVVFKINDIGNTSDNESNLDELDRTFVLNSNGTEGYLLHSTRLSKINVNVSSGGATIKVDYEGW